jgi:hypothetical protein
MRLEDLPPHVGRRHPQALTPVKLVIPSKARDLLFRLFSLGGGSFQLPRNDARAQWASAPEESFAVFAIPTM